MSSERFVTALPLPEAADITRRFIDLAQPRLGTEVTFASDDFFADKSRMIDPAPPLFYPDRFDDHGKWMDGWESRRKRVPGHDHAVIRLGQRGVVSAIDIDTSFFTGNFPPEAMVEAADTIDTPGDDDWTVIVPRAGLKGDSHNLFTVEAGAPVRWLRLNIYPDGGIARLRVFGTIAKDWSLVSPEETIDLAAMENGGTAVAWNDAHYGHPANLMAPGRAPVMADGWETARRRTPGNDWCVLKLGTAGRIERIAVDTNHFKGNFPDRFTLRAGRLGDETASETIDAISRDWPLVVSESRLTAHDVVKFAATALDEPVTHVRLDIFPDGGVSRLRIWGKKA